MTEGRAQVKQRIHRGLNKEYLATDKEPKQVLHRVTGLKETIRAIHGWDNEFTTTFTEALAGRLVFVRKKLVVDVREPSGSGEPFANRGSHEEQVGRGDIIHGRARFMWKIGEKRVDNQARIKKLHSKDRGACLHIYESWTRGELRGRRNYPTSRTRTTHHAT